MPFQSYTGMIMCTRLIDLNPMPGEVFIDITEDMFPGIFPYYKVSNMGRVYNKYSRQFIGSLNTGNSGYIHLNLSGNPNLNIDMQRLVMIAFNPVPGYQNLDVNHKDGNKLNNRLDNLEWCTRSENQLHAFRTGLNKSGEDSTSAKYTNAQVEYVCELLQNTNYTQQQIADIVGVSVHLVNDVKQGRWKSISGKYQFSYRKFRLLSDSDVERICQYFQDNPKPSNITNKDHVVSALQYLSLPVDDKVIDTVRHIFDKKYYKSITSKYNF